MKMFKKILFACLGLSLSIGGLAIANRAIEKPTMEAKANTRQWLLGVMEHVKTLFIIPKQAMI